MHTNNTAAMDYITARLGSEGSPMLASGETTTRSSGPRRRGTRTSG
ncbi:hypothetical protein AHiyo6_09020 [Arthrobacter sp. Hiyo6]|nr:hypothetical protein AHiyo6_09020 [Arthrobacter sp. Hiyo6]